MLPYTPTDIFTDSDIYDLTDLVKGGLLGESNIPIKALLDRTFYLFNRLARFEGVKELTGNYTYDVADARKAFLFTISANTTFILPDVTSLAPGSLIPINATISAIKALTVQTQLSQKINDGTEQLEEMYLHNGDRLVLMAAGDHYEIANAIGNFYLAGESAQVRLQGKNMILGQGQLVNRADMPRVARFLSKLTLWEQKVSDAIWLSDPSGKPVYRGLYSEGNETTTMRLPDERGLFIRNLDQGRGMDVSRLHDYAGGLELDEIKSHSHGPGSSVYKGHRTKDVAGGVQTLATGPANSEPPLTKSQFTAAEGGSESRPINIGKFSMIYY